MFFQELQFSSILLCYGPLLLVVGGFIAFAALTDRHARRTYLRNLNQRVDEERSDAVVAPPRRPITVQTPAGYAVTLEPGAVEPAVVMESPVVAEPVPQVETEVAPEAVSPDDLTRIEGIGPKIASVLNAARIMTFAELANYQPQELRRILDDAGMPRIIDPATWPAQAALAAAEEWEALATLQEELTGGRH